MIKAWDQPTWAWTRKLKNKEEHWTSTQAIMVQKDVDGGWRGEDGYEDRDEF